MGYLDRIRPLHVHAPERYVPFRVDGASVGAIRRDRLSFLREAAPALRVEEDDVRFAGSRWDAVARSEALADAARRLAEAGLVASLRGETYDVRARSGEPPLFRLDRAAARFFGVRAHGVHLNGYVEDAQGLQVWVGRRSLDVPVDPGALDHLVAGGVPSGLGVRETLVKEAGEEAGMSPTLAAEAVEAGTLRYRMDADDGLRDDTLHLFDLRLPEVWIPRNRDGEVSAFERWSKERLRRALLDGAVFKFNVGAVMIDFLLRHDAGGFDAAECSVLRGALRRGET